MQKILKVVQLSSNPISGSPWELNKLLQSSPLIESRFISGTDTYKEIDGVPSRKFPSDLLWNEDREECIKIIQEADILHCHNTIFPENLQEYIQPHQKVVVQLYSVHRDALQSQIDKALFFANIIVIADQPWQKDVYKNISAKYLPLVKTDFKKSKRHNVRPIIVYSPTNKYDLTHIYSKGYNEVISVINELKEKFNFEFRLIEGVDYEKNLELKRNGDILIDDIINENAMHGSSIEASAYGAVPLTNYTGTDFPFYKTNLSSLKANLTKLLNDKTLLSEEQQKIHKWFIKKYYPSLLQRYERFYFYECINQQTQDANCNTPDMVYAKYDIMKIMTEWLKKHGIFHFLAFGTALVAIRDNKFETDVDLGLWYRDRWKVYNLLQTDPPEGIEANCIWRTEFTFRFKSRPYPKLDLFFFEKMNDSYSCYLHTRNPFNNNVSWEREFKISKQALSKFINFNFYGQKVKVPKNYELYFQENYGMDWEIPNKKALGLNGRPCYNSEHREYAICMVTFMRDDKMKECVESIRKYYPDDWVRIYIADQNENISDETQKYYNNLASKGHVIVKVPYNSGLSHGRNTLVNQVKEPYLLIVDDDFRFTNKTDLTKLKNVLESKDDIGICGGKLLGQDPYLAWMYYNPILKKIFKIKTNYVPHPIFKTQKYPYRPTETLYEYSDIVLNFFLAKTEVFKDFQWDEDLVLAEHTDAFLRLKETKWKVVYTTEVECEHNHFNNSSDYQNFRSNINRDIGVERFCKKWNINDLSDIYNIPSKTIKDKYPIIKEPPIVEILPKTIQTVEDSFNLNQIFMQVTNILDSLNINYCLVKETCKDAVLYKTIQTGNKLFFACTVTEELKKKLFDLGFTLENDCFKKSSYIIYFCTPELKTKNWLLNDKVYKVPFPLISYLKNTFGPSINNELKQRGYT